MREPLPAEVLKAMFHVEGEDVVTGAGARVQLRGIVFTNDASENTEIPSGHHQAEDYARVRKMGMNSVRFDLSPQTFEDNDAPFVYKQSGFFWMDQNIEWAKQNKVRLILNLHAPPGVSQSGGGDDAFWEDSERKARFVKLWRALAKRYRAEPTVIGFSLLSSPNPSKGLPQWQELAQRTVDEIRLVDQHHIIFVEGATRALRDESPHLSQGFVRVRDENVVYVFDFEAPLHFTHQNAKKRPYLAREGWYPDENVIEVEGHHLKMEAVVESQGLPPGASSWTMLETKPYVVEDEKLVVGRPFLVCDQAEGSVVFDSLSLTRVLVPEDDAPKVVPPASAKKKAAEKEEEPEPLEIVFEVDLDTRRGWHFSNPSGKGSADFLPAGNGDHTALSISGTQGPASLGSELLRFQPEPGYEYQLQGLARGKDLAEESRCGLRLEFYSSAVPIKKRDKSYLEQELGAYLAIGEQEKVPLYLGEFGTIRDSFLPGRGGVKWVEDMLELLNEREVSFAYHAYHESDFGLFTGGRGLPSADAANQPLYETLVKALVGPDADTKLFETKPTRASSSEHLPEKKQPENKEQSEGVPPQEKGETTPENYHDFE